jgi:hypothetical protein
MFYLHPYDEQLFLFLQDGPDGQADDLRFDQGGHGRAEHGESGSNEENLDRVRNKFSKKVFSV